MAAWSTTCGGPPLAQSETVLGFATYLGGAREDEARAVAIDDAGYVYVTGSTDSVDFPVTRSGRPLGGSRDAFVAKFAPDGRTLVWAVYLGGSGPDYANAIAVDASGNVYVAGETQSQDFPVTPGALQPKHGGAEFSRDAFVAKLNPAGDTLVYATYLGGNYDDAATAIAVDDAGNAHVTGWTWAENFPTVNALKSRWSGEICVIAVSPSGGNPMVMHPCEDAFVAKLDPSGGRLVFSTYLGGRNRDLAAAIALDAQANVWVAGATRSDDFPLASPVQARHGGGTCELPTSFPSGWSRYTCEDAFVVKLGAQGDRLEFSTFLGGERADLAHSIAVDAAGTALAAGETASSAFPTTQGAMQTTHRGGTDAFLARFRAAGAMTFSTLLGGTGDDRAAGLALDPAGNAYLAGTTTSGDFPLTPGSPETASGRGFLTKIDAAGARSLFSGRLRADWAAVAVDALGVACVAGRAGDDFATTPGAFQPANRGGTDAAVGRLDLFTEPQIAPNGAVNAASYVFGPVAPGEIVTIFGIGIGPRRAATLTLNPTGLADNLLAGTRVFFDGRPAPVIYTQATQTSVVVPYAVAGRAVTELEIEHRGRRTAALRLAAAEAAPGIFALDSSGKGAGAVLNQDYTINSAANPAPRGSVVMIYATGEGQTEPPGVDGKPAAEPLPRPRLPVSVRIGGVDATVVYAGGAPGLVAGVWQVNARIPDAVTPGASVPVVVSVAGKSSQPDITLAVR